MTEDTTELSGNKTSMDYPEHEKTYRFFIAGTKYGSVLVAALMIAIAAGLVGPFGFIGGLIVFILVSAISIYTLR